MKPEDIKKLLGGYATGTLTPEEQQALFAAAVDDQELFDALAREQSLRDLLRDPSARAELLGALDTPSGRTGGFWQWVRRPMVAGLASAGVVAIAVVAVWRGAPPKQAAPLMVAELKPQEQAPVAAAPAAPRPHPARPRPLPMATPPPPPPTLPEPPAPAPAPSVMARKAEADSTSQSVMVQGQASAVPPAPVTLDARALFYANQPPTFGTAFVQSGSGNIAPARPDALLRSAKAAPASRLGVRVSILRGETEVDLATVLDPGETVRLKLIPNSDGFLYVTEGARLLSSGTAQRLKPFETPELRFEGGGPKQLYVMLSRSPQTVAPQSLGTLAGNLVETPATQERATYVVSGALEAGARQVVVPVTLNYR